MAAEEATGKVGSDSTDETRRSTKTGPADFENDEVSESSDAPVIELSASMDDDDAGMSIGAAV